MVTASLNNKLKKTVTGKEIGSLLINEYRISVNRCHQYLEERSFQMKYLVLFEGHFWHTVLEQSQNYG
jgi:hypothetical protein